MTSFLNMLRCNTNYRLAETIQRIEFRNESVGYVYTLMNGNKK